MATDYLIRYISDLSNVQQSAKQVEQINKDMASTLSGEFAKATRVVGTSLNKISETPIKIDGQAATKQVSQLGTVVQTANGGFQEFIKTQTFVNGQLVKTQGSLKDVTNQFGQTAVTSEKAKTGVKNLADNVRELTSRALITIPVWLALRSVMVAVTKTFKDGANALVEQDKALQKAKRNITGTTEEIEDRFNKLKSTARAFSIETGESVENIVTAFQRFATTGLDFETSMRGALASTKTAVLLFGETEEVANAVARAFRVLGGRTNDFKSDGEELESTLALVSELWKTNAFEIDEFNGAIERVAPTAKASNLALTETVALLSAIQTAGIRGTRAGRLLSTAVTKMEKNFSKFDKTLGINLGSVDSTFKRLRLVAGAIDDIQKADPVKAGQAVQELFGRRGGDVVKALVAMRSELEGMVDARGDIAKFNSEFVSMQEQTFRQVEIFKNLRTEIGKAFLIGATGGDDFASSLKEINGELKELRIESEKFGTFVRTISSSTLGFRPSDFLGEGSENLDEETKTRIDKLFTNMINYAQVSSPRSILSTRDILFSDVGADTSLEDFANETINQLQDDLKKAVEQKSKISIAPEDLFEISEAVLDSEVDRLKASGALVSELIKAEQIMRKQLGIEEKGLKAVEQKLALEKAIREERRLQSRLGSESLKLFDISKTEGKDIAKKIGDVLAGEVSFDNFVKRGGEAFEVFKENFADVFKQQEAQKFFKGAGSGINIREEAIRGTTPGVGRTLLQQAKSESTFLRSQQVSTTVNVPIDMDVNIDITKLDEVQQKFISKVSTEITRAGSQLNKSVAKAVTGTNTL